MYSRLRSSASVFSSQVAHSGIDFRHVDSAASELMLLGDEFFHGGSAVALAIQHINDEAGIEEKTGSSAVFRQADVRSGTQRLTNAAEPFQVRDDLRFPAPGSIIECPQQFLLRTSRSTISVRNALRFPLPNNWIDVAEQASAGRRGCALYH